MKAAVITIPVILTRPDLEWQLISVALGSFALGVALESFV
jgi:hypothetical protein